MHKQVDEITISARLAPKGLGMRQGFELAHVSGRSLIAFPDDQRRAIVEARPHESPEKARGTGRAIRSRLLRWPL